HAVPARRSSDLVRRVRFLVEMTASILSNNRIQGPFGMAGGCPGAVGVNRVERGDGSSQVLGHIDSCTMQAGDVFIIETPGGGGYGRPEVNWLQLGTLRTSVRYRLRFKTSAVA